MAELNRATIPGKGFFIPKPRAPQIYLQLGFFDWDRTSEGEKEGREGKGRGDDGFGRQPPAKQSLIAFLCCGRRKFQKTERSFLVAIAQRLHALDELRSRSTNGRFVVSRWKTLFCHLSIFHPSAACCGRRRLLPRSLIIYHFIRIETCE